MKYANRVVKDMTKIHCLPPVECKFHDFLAEINLPYLLLYLLAWLIIDTQEIFTHIH